MKLSNEMIEEIKKTNSIDQLKQKVKDNSLDFDDEEIKKAYNFYHSNELNDEELDNVTGGCGYPVINLDDEACDDFEDINWGRKINKQEFIEIYGLNQTVECRWCNLRYHNTEDDTWECRK